MGLYLIKFKQLTTTIVNVWSNITGSNWNWPTIYEIWIHPPGAKYHVILMPVRLIISPTLIGFNVGTAYIRTCNFEHFGFMMDTSRTCFSHIVFVRFVTLNFKISARWKALNSLLYYQDSNFLDICISYLPSSREEGIWIPTKKFKQHLENS